MDVSGIVDMVLGGDARGAAALVARSAELRAEVVARLESRVADTPEPSPLLELSSLFAAHRSDGVLRERLLLAEFRIHLGELDRAVEELQVLRRDPRAAVRAFNLLGLCFSRKRGLNMMELAIKQFRKGLESSPSREEELELRYNLAVLLQSEKRWQEAFHELTHLLKIASDYRDARQRWLEVRGRLR